MQKMVPVKAVPGIREGGMKESSKWGEFKYDVSETLLLRSFVNATMYSHPAQQ
jgi:hypothetical protein